MRALSGISIATLILALSAAQPLAARADTALNADLQLLAHDLGEDRAEVADVALKIASLDVKVDIIGHQAQTTLIITFANPSDGDLEGDFSLDLPAGATVTGYGLDIKDVLTDGVLQPRLQATEAYEESLRHGVDPGLATVDAGNRFTTHIFPIPAEGGRTVKIVYVTPLAADGHFEVPLGTSGAVDDFHLEVTAHDMVGPLKISLPGTLDKNTAGEILKDKNTYHFAAGAKDRILSGNLVLSGLTPANPVSLSRHGNGETFFEMVVPAEPAGAFKAKSVRLYWDASRSRRDQDTQGEAQLIADYVAKTTPRSLDLVVFADSAPRVVHIDAPTAAAVLEALGRITYGGATRFESLEKVLPGRADVCIVVSDGGADIGSFAANRWPCRVMTLSSAKSARRDILGQLAGRNDGVYVDLGDLGHDKALTQLLVRAPKLWDIIDDDGASLDYMVTPMGDDLYRVIGPWSPSSGIDLDYNGQDQAYVTRGLTAADNDGAGTMWGHALIDRLTATDAPDNDKVLELARHYHVATPDISFLVLENGTAYARAGVEPPKTASHDIWDDYTAARDRMAETARTAKDERLSDVEALWTEEKAWWNGPAVSLKDATKMYKRRARAGDIEDDRGGGEVGAPPPAPAMAPPPVVQPRATPPSAIEPVDAEPMAGIIAGNDIGALPDSNGEIGSDENQMVVVTGVRRAPLGPLGEARIDVQTAEWNPDRPYLRALIDIKGGDQAGLDTVLAVQEKQYGDTPGFYFDVAEWMYRNGFAAGAAGMARNALDLPGSDIDSQIILADRLLRYGAYDDAISIDEHVVRLTPEKPQATRNLALALVTATDARLAAGTVSKSAAVVTYRRALSLLSEVVLKPWSGDYDGIEVIALMEANHLVARLKSLGEDEDDLTDILPAELTDLLDVDIRITLEWNTDKTDMDLWVDEPSGERAIYSNPKTSLGGRLSNDMTRGYGPEEYLLHYAPAGTYAVLANVYAADVINRNGATSITVHLYRDWGRATEKVETFVIELKKDDKGAVKVGSFVRQ